uniref:Probable glutamate receptor n=1 Tax=Crassostrea virginica TaxID=6565 RepID=A0A8B8B735_CRAVI|nr:probable glutamate receptor [Crassostrea virginica]
MRVLCVCLCLDLVIFTWGRQLTVTSILKPPLLMESGSPGQYEGYIVDILNSLASQNNFTYSIVPEPDGVYGVKDDKGNWNGMMGKLVNKKADLAAADLTVSSTRRTAVSFTSPILHGGKRILVFTPQVPPHNGLVVLFEPFSGDVWVMLMVVCIIVGILLTIINRYSPSEWSKIPEAEDKTNSRESFTINNALFFVHTTVTWQGFKEAPRSPGGRFLASMWMSFVLFMITAYIANLASFIIARTPDKAILPFKTFHQMEMQSEVAYGTKSWDTFLQRSKDPVLNRLDLISRSDPDNNLFETDQEGYERVRDYQGSFAAIMESHVAEYYAGRDCSVMVVGEKAEPTEQAIACSNASLCAELSTSMNNVPLKELRQKWWPNSCGTTLLSEFLNKPEVTLLTPARPLNTIDLSIAFILLLLGIIVGVLMMVIEVYIARKKAQKEGPIKMKSTNGDKLVTEGTDEEKAPIAEEC